MRTSTRAVHAAAIVGAGIAAPLASAQEAMYTAAATMASPHTLILREQFHVWRYGSSPADGSERTDKYILETSVQYGLARAWSVTLDAPFSHTATTDAESGDKSSHDGVDELDVNVKHRFYQNDSGGVDTVRAAVMFGAHAAFEDQAHVDPHLGAVVTVVRGRWGVNQDLGFRLTTGGEESNNFGGDGPADAIFHNTSLLYRIDPPAFTSQTRGAWYVTGEINGLYETNGDYEVRWSPGLMYEGREFAFELMAQFPLWEDVDRRAELDWGVGFGFRFLF